MAIVSGDKGPGEEISEAKAMQQGLIAQGIEEARIMMEDKSTTTHENIVFSKDLIPDTKALGSIVSNDFSYLPGSRNSKKRRLGHEGNAGKDTKSVIIEIIHP
ncbi:YdcF family protein [Peribacillus simplex]|uniref:YdcF family protein n=1 Tax=Peribacillus simplex TaxID=1478 RepID=UPI003EBADE71